MWKQILTKINAALLSHWSQLVWFVLGTLMGAVLLGGMVGCSTAPTCSIEESQGSTTPVAEEVVTEQS